MRGADCSAQGHASSKVALDRYFGFFSVAENSLIPSRNSAERSFSGRGHLGEMTNTKRDSVIGGGHSYDTKERIPDSIGWLDAIGIENRKMQSVIVHDERIECYLNFQIPVCSKPQVQF